MPRIVKIIERHGWINLLEGLPYLVILMIIAGCTSSPSPEIEPQASKTANVATPPKVEETATTTSTPPSHSAQTVQVKFRDGTDIDPPEMTLPAELRSSVASITRLFTQSDQELERIGASKLKYWFQITLIQGTDTTDFIEQLKSLDNVEIAEKSPSPAPPP